MLKSPAWWSIAIGIIGAAFTFAITRATVEANTDTRVTTLEQQVPAMEQRIMSRIDRNKDEVIDEIREIRRLMSRDKE